MARIQLRRIRAMTLLELQITIAISAVLMFATVSATGVAMRMSNEAQSRLALRRDTAIALRFIQRQARGRSADDISIEDAGATLSLSMDGGITHTFSLTEGSMVFSDGVETQTVIDGTVSSLAFALEDGNGPGTYVVSVEMNLARGSDVVQTSSTIQLRN